MIRVFRPGRHRHAAAPDSKAEKRGRHAGPEDRSSLLPGPASLDRRVIACGQILPAHLMMLR
jgi:hypothetical protein